MSLEIKIKEWFEQVATEAKVLKNRHQLVVWIANTLTWPWLWVDTAGWNLQFWIEDWL